MATEEEIANAFDRVRTTFFPKMRKWTLYITSQTLPDYDDRRYIPFTPYMACDRSANKIRVSPLIPREFLEKGLIHAMAVAVTSGSIVPLEFSRPGKLRLWAKRMEKVAIKAESLGRADLADIRDHIANGIAHHERYVERLKRSRKSISCAEIRGQVMFMVDYEAQYTNKIPSYWETLGLVANLIDDHVTSSEIMVSRVKDLSTVYEKAVEITKGYLYDEDEYNALSESERVELLEFEKTERLRLRFGEDAFLQLNSGLNRSSSKADSVLSNCKFYMSIDGCSYPSGCDVCIPEDCDYILDGGVTDIAQEARHYGGRT